MPSLLHRQCHVVPIATLIADFVGVAPNHERCAFGQPAEIAEDRRGRSVIDHGENGPGGNGAVAFRVKVKGRARVDHDTVGRHFVRRALGGVYTIAVARAGVESERAADVQGDLFV